MKKIIALLLAVAMVLSMAACGKDNKETTAAATTEAEKTTAAATTEAETTQAQVTAKTYKLGMGIDLNTESSKTGTAQVDAVVAAVVLDGDKIVAARIDAVQDKMTVTDGAVDTEKTFKTKMELGDDYNMKKYSSAVAEWYDQAKAFEAYVVGKTGAEVEAMELVTNEEGHKVTTDATLKAQCSISIETFIAAVVKACADEQGMTFETAEAFTLGVAAASVADESKAATAEAEGVVKMYSEYAAAVIVGGKVVACLNDATQPQIKINAAGEIGDTTFKGTKRELKEGYNMVKYGSAIAEWYQQALAFSEYCVGKTAAEIRAFSTSVNGEGHQVTTDATLLAKCTMSIDGMMNVIATAAEYAR